MVRTLAKNDKLGLGTLVILEELGIGTRQS